MNDYLGSVMKRSWPGLVIGVVMGGVISLLWRPYPALARDVEIVWFSAMFAALVWLSWRDLRATRKLLDEMHRMDAFMDAALMEGQARVDVEMQKAEAAANRLEAALNCPYCAQGNPRIPSSVNPDVWVHTDTPVGRVVCPKGRGELIQ